MSTAELLAIANIGATNYTLITNTTVCNPNVTTIKPPQSNLINDLLNSTSTQASLSQSQTNGNSTLGTLDFPGLALWVPTTNTTGTPPFQQPANGTAPPWGNATVNNTNPEIPPNTGVTRFYDFTVSRDTLSPDGVNRSMLLINGQFPGPMIEANWGDTIQVTVHNAIVTASEDGITVDQEGTALHWHGLLQKDTPYYDGVPGVQQCPIAPNSNFTYTFQADLYGTSWYHSHFSAQYAGGAFGPMIIHGPTSQDYDIDIGPIMISDWNHQEYYRLVQQDVGPNQQVINSNNTLINGKMAYDCNQTQFDTEPHTCTENAGLAKFNFQSGKNHLLRLINPSAEAILIFSIDSHDMTVIAQDFVPVQPYAADYVTLGVGQRMDVIVEGSGDSGSAHWMRVNASAGCSAAFQGQALAAIYYEGADTNSVPPDNRVAIQDDCALGNIADDATTKGLPAFPSTTPSTWATQQRLNISIGPQNGTCSNLFAVNGQTFRTDYNDPILLDAYNGNFNFDPQRNVYDFGTNSSVLLYVENSSPIAHPMHLHGHNFWVLAVSQPGSGPWDGSTAGFSNNPPRRDVIVVEPGRVNATTKEVDPSYAIIGYETNNPGIWPFHCHIAWHVGAGLYVNLMEQPQALPTNDTGIPAALPQTCTDWNAFTSSNFVDQIDSGLRIVRARN